MTQGKDQRLLFSSLADPDFRQVRELQRIASSVLWGRVDGERRKGEVREILRLLQFSISNAISWRYRFLSRNVYHYCSSPGSQGLLGKVKLSGV